MYDYTNINASLSQRIGMSIEKYKYPYVCYVCMVYATRVITYMHMCTSTCLHINITSQKAQSVSFFSTGICLHLCQHTKEIVGQCISSQLNHGQSISRLMVLTLMKTWSSKAFSSWKKTSFVANVVPWIYHYLSLSTPCKEKMGLPWSFNLSIKKCFENPLV